MIGVMFVGVFCAVGFAYAATEYAMTAFDVRRRVTVGEAPPSLLLAVHAVSLLLVWASALILVVASRQSLYLPASVIALGAQAVWLAQDMLFYWREHLRVQHEH